MSEQAESIYAGDIDDPTATPLRDSGFQKLEFEDPATLFIFFNPTFSEGTDKLHKWQVELLESFGNIKPTSIKPHKFCLRAANGSGKDSIIVAAFVVWFMLSKIQSRVIVTSSSGQQLTAQTENAIRLLCENVNKFFGEEYVRIRQRYYKCRFSGSEIRLFATDEAGKAEGYHPMVSGAEMAVVVSEGKSVSEEIHQALRRCTGYNYWIEVSTPGEPKGFFHKIATTWTDVELKNIAIDIKSPGAYTSRVTSYDCPHLPPEDLEYDKKDLGEHSAFFRSKHLALFTSIGGEVIIPCELVEQVYSSPSVEFKLPKHPIRIGIDLAAGGDENCIIVLRNNVLIREIAWREVDTVATAERLDRELGALSREFNFDKKHEQIYADDGGIGHSIIDMLVSTYKWTIVRILNQWGAINKRNFGNRGAENWYRVKRFFEEGLLNITKGTDKLREQLGDRRYKQQLQGARVYLQSKKEAKAHGFLSPDRADALILALTGLSIEEFLKAKSYEKPLGLKDFKINKDEQVLRTDTEVQHYFEEKVRYKDFNVAESLKTTSKRIWNSLRDALEI